MGGAGGSWSWPAGFFWRDIREGEFYRESNCGSDKYGLIKCKIFFQNLKRKIFYVNLFRLNKPRKIENIETNRAFEPLTLLSCILI